MKPHFTPVLVLASCILAAAMSLVAQDGRPREPETVVVPSDGLKLHARLFYPNGQGPFPAVLFNHGSGHTRGSAPGGADHRHPELLGPVFAQHGYVFLYLYRRGDGLSAGQGIPSGDRMNDAFAAGGQQARNQMQLRLLEGDEMDDAMAGLTYLRALPQIDTRRVAVVGHSFGGSLTVLLAERDPSIRAIVTFGAVGYSWDRSPDLRTAHNGSRTDGSCGLLHSRQERLFHRSGQESCGRDEPTWEGAPPADIPASRPNTRGGA